MEEIADRCGYNSPVHFSRQFRKCTGYAPSKWRENALGENMVVTDHG
jgi:AraC-like DNA-binding protein